MEALIVIAILCLAGGGTSVYYERKRNREEYEAYMARRIAFSVSEFNSKE